MVSIWSPEDEGVGGFGVVAVSSWWLLFHRTALTTQLRSRRGADAISWPHPAESGGTDPAEPASLMLAAQEAPLWPLAKSKNPQDRPPKRQRAGCAWRRHLAFGWALGRLSRRIKQTGDLIRSFGGLLPVLTLTSPTYFVSKNSTDLLKHSSIARRTCPLFLRVQLNQRRFFSTFIVRHRSASPNPTASKHNSCASVAMHRTYSMRASRAPTASQIQVLEAGFCCRIDELGDANHQSKQNPPPPPSTTKSGRLFGRGGLGELRLPSLPATTSLVMMAWIWARDLPSRTLTGGLGHALRRNAAGAFGPDLAKKLAQLVKMEKNVMRSLEMVAKERMEVAVCGSLLSWPVGWQLANRNAATTVNLGRGVRRRRVGCHRQAWRAAIRDWRARGPIRRPIRSVPRHGEEHSEHRGVGAAEPRQ
jgi:hypothetical protein